MVNSSQNSRLWQNKSLASPVIIPCHILCLYHWRDLATPIPFLCIRPHGWYFSHHCPLLASSVGQVRIPQAGSIFFFTLMPYMYSCIVQNGRPRQSYFDLCGRHHFDCLVSFFFFTQLATSMADAIHSALMLCWQWSFTSPCQKPRSVLVGFYFFFGDFIVIPRKHFSLCSANVCVLSAKIDSSVKALQQYMSILIFSRTQLPIYQMVYCWSIC